MRDRHLLAEVGGPSDDRSRSALKRVSKEGALSFRITMTESGNGTALLSETLVIAEVVCRSEHLCSSFLFRLTAKLRSTQENAGCGTDETPAVV